MDKYDIKKAMKPLYHAPAGRFVQVDMPAMRYLMIDGAGDPNTSPDYAAAVEALYTTAYTLKFKSKAELGRDYVVPPLEGLWWAEDLSDFVARRKDRWRWTMMIAVPEFVPMAAAEQAIAQAVAKKGLPALSRLRVDVLEEGLVVQTLHVGAYDDEGPTLRRLHEEYLPAQGLVPTGHHHEVYLSDPRKTAAERLKTVLRQPVRVGD